jgi:osmotically-inducible protein OsmY
MNVPMSNTLFLPLLAEQDRSIHERVSTVLQRTGYTPLQSIDCRVDNGVVELRGHVPSFYLKQLAQAVILPLKYVRGIKNDIRVS